MDKNNKFIESMIQKQIIRRGISDERVINAMRKVPRHLFMPPEEAEYAYQDTPSSIGFGQTISQPYIVAYMTQELKLNGSEKVLEIGTGSGYQTAVLAGLAGHVYTVEIIKELADRAELLFGSRGYKNISVKKDSGYEGWSREAPFDRIIVTCAPPEIPGELISQLKEGGIMIIPAGAGYSQELIKGEKKHGKLITTNLMAVRFVPML